MVEIKNSIRKLFIEHSGKESDWICLCPDGSIYSAEEIWRQWHLWYAIVAVVPCIYPESQWDTAESGAQRYENMQYSEKICFLKNVKSEHRAGGNKPTIIIKEVSTTRLGYGISVPKDLVSSPGNWGRVLRKKIRTLHLAIRKVIWGQDTETQGGHHPRLPNEIIQTH